MQICGHAALRAELADNPFGRPLYVESSENAGEHKGAIYADIEQPFKRVGAALRRAAAERMEQRLRAFHAGLERYPRQLHELELAEYLEIKRRDASRVLQARG